MKRCYRFFGGLLSTQEKWLNKMAHKGYRLVKTGKFTYDFEECPPDQYQYVVEFVANQSYKSEKKYCEFLEDLGYTVFYKNINLNYSAFKIVWRPYGKGSGQLSTNPGSYNKELFIVEKENDGRPFEMHTTNEDLAAYYKPIRNSWITLLILFLGLSIWQFIITSSITKEVIVFGIAGILVLFPVLYYHKTIKHFIKASKDEG